MDATITGGSIKYGETRKMADFENKRVDVELAYNVAAGRNADEAMQQVAMMATKQCQKMLDGKAPIPEWVSKSIVPSVGLADTPEKSTTLKQPKRAPKMPVAENMPPNSAPVAEIKAVDPAALEEPIDAAKPLPEAQTSDAPIITDAELMDATSKHQEQVKNAIAIRKLMNDLGLKAPPGKLIDLPQDKRQEYLDKLILIKPLA